MNLYGKCTSTEATATEMIKEKKNNEAEMKPNRGELCCFRFPFYLLLNKTKKTILTLLFYLNALVGLCKCSLHIISHTQIHMR